MTEDRRPGTVLVKETKECAIININIAVPGGVRIKRKKDKKIEDQKLCGACSGGRLELLLPKFFFPAWYYLASGFHLSGKLYSS